MDKVGEASCAGWQRQEISVASLPDKRLARRLERLLDQFSAAPGKPVPAACVDWASTKAAYRFFDNPRVTEHGVLAGHFAVMVTDKLGSYGAARSGMGMTFEHRQHKGLNNRAENSHLPTRRRERIMKRFKSARHLQRFVSIHDPIANFHNCPRHAMSSSDDRALRSGAMAAWREIAEPGVAA